MPGARWAYEILTRVMRPLLVIAALCTFTGCAATGLPYKPEPQPPGAKLSAAYSVAGSRLRIEIDTDGRRLEEAKILRPDGSDLQAQTIEHPGYSPYPSSGVTVGVGMGGGSWGGGGGVGGGVGVGVPIGGGSPRVAGNTLAYFPLDQAGPVPWRLRVKVAEIEPIVIVVGGTPPGAK